MIRRFQAVLRGEERGIIMVGALIVTSFFLITSLAVAEFSVRHYVSTRRTLIASSTINAADAAADAFMAQINQSSTYQGTTNAPGTATNSCTGYTSTPVVLINNSVQGKITYESCVQNGTVANEKLVYVTAKSYLPANASKPTVTRKLKLVINGATAPPTTYGVQSGPGGLYLSGNNAGITAGPVYVSGKLKLDSGARIGSTASPVETYVANNACKNTATNTIQTCTVGQSSNIVGPIQTPNPIYIYGANIYGNVHAVNFKASSDYDTNYTLQHMSNAGYVDATVPADTGLPVESRSAVKATMTTTTPQANANCVWPTNTVTWAAGTHFTGSGQINMYASTPTCKALVKGNIWIDGSIVLSQAQLVVDEGVTTPPIIMIDGSSGFHPTGNSSLIPNSAGVGFKVITYWANSSCSPECTSLNATELANSINTTTMILDGTTQMTGSTIYARWTEIHASVSATVGSLIGQYILIDNGASVKVSSGNSGSTATGGWDVKYYEQIYK